MSANLETGDLKRQTAKVRRFILNLDPTIHAPDAYVQKPRETIVTPARAAPHAHRPSHYRPGAIHIHATGLSTAPLPPYPASGK
jgi:hypothetical protein